MGIPIAPPMGITRTARALTHPGETTVYPGSFESFGEFRDKSLEFREFREFESFESSVPNHRHRVSPGFPHVGVYVLSVQLGI
jgi:hypothetical protein